MSDFETVQLRGIIQGLGPPNAGLSAIDPATTLATTIYRDRTAVTGGYYQCMPDGAGVNAWVPLTAGGGAATAMWPNYVVSADADIPAPYTTIAAAYAAAAAAGHGAANPATILVHPGAYAEPLVLDTAGIAIEGLSVPGTSGVLITGPVSITAVDAVGVVGLSNLTIGGLVTASSAGVLNVRLDGVYLVQVGLGTALAWTAAAGSSLSMTDVLMLSTGGVPFDASAAVTLSITAHNVSFAAHLTGVALRLGDATVSGQRFTSCNGTGTIEITAGASAANARQFDGCRFSTTGPATKAILSLGAPNVAQATFIGGVIACEHAGSAINNLAQTAAYTFVGTQFPGVRGASCEIATTLVATAAVNPRPWNVTQDVTGVLPVEARGVRTGVIGGADAVLTLPDIRQVPDGEAIQIKRTTANAFNVVVVGGGGVQGVVDNAANSVTLTLQTETASITVRADRARATWCTEALVGTFTSP